MHRYATDIEYKSISLLQNKKSTQLSFMPTYPKNFYKGRENELVINDLDWFC